MSSHILITCSGGKQQEQRKEDRDQRFWKDPKACPEGSAEGKVAGGHEIENIPPPG